MESEFITRVERDKDEPYTVIFRTDDADKYKYIEDECRRMIGHEKPTVDVVPVVRCRECIYAERARVNDKGFTICEASYMDITDNDFCSYGERRTE